MKRRGRVIRGVRDLYTDVAIELRSQVMKTALLIGAVILSIGALLASVGISRSAAHQVDAELAASTINLVTVEFTEATKAGDTGSDSTSTARGSNGSPQGKASQRMFPDDAVARATAVPAVQSAGMRLDISGVTTIRVTRHDVGLGGDTTGIQGVTVTSLTSGYLRTSEVDAVAGDVSILDSDLPVAFLGERAAEALGIPVVANTSGVSFEINDEEYAVAGFLPGESEFGKCVVIPYEHGFGIVGADQQSVMLIRTRIGAGSQVSTTIRHAILPNAPGRLNASQVVSAEKARGSVSAQMARQAAWVGGFLIVLTTLLIANSMVVSVTARTTEIGVRRALGSSRRAVASVFWFEGALVGLLGGLGGSALAAWVIVGVSAASGWTALLNPAWIAVGPVLGAAVGLVASAYPALRASRIHPAIAVRSN